MGNKSDKNVLSPSDEAKETSPISFDWDRLRFTQEDVQILADLFQKTYKEELKKNNLEQTWKDKFWDAFLNRIVSQEKRVWHTARLSEAQQKQDYVIHQNESSTIKRAKRANRSSFLRGSYKTEYENMVRMILSHLESTDPQEKQWKEDFFNKFIDTVQIYTNPVKFMEEYFQWPSEITLEHVQENKLPRHFQWVVDDGRINNISDQELVDTIKEQQKVLGSKLMVRIIISSLNKVDKQSIWGGLSVLIAPHISPLGLNHASLQVGPYLIHWTESNLVTVHNVGEHKNVMALIYPDTKFVLDTQDKENVMKLCEVIVDYNKKMYDKYSNNCQKFVDVALESIGCQKKWLKNGPIENFLSHVAKLDCTASKMTFWDLKGKEHSFKNYNEFKKYCQDDPEIQDLLKKRLVYAVGEDPEKAEFLQVLKAIERGFLVQLPNNQSMDNSSLLFPVQTYEDIGNVTSLPGVTISVV